MIREKFKKPSEPTNQEKQFISFLERTGSARITTLELITKNASQRKLRKYKERYNNAKYIGYVPKGEIHQQGNRYVLITPEHEQANYYRLKEELDFVCKLIARKNSHRNIGKLQLKGQMQFSELIQAELDTLENYATQLELDIENEE